MTTIAWDGKFMAADRRMADWQVTGKLFVLQDGRVLAGAGFMDEVYEVAAWLDAGGDARDRPEVSEGDDSTEYLLMIGGVMHWLTSPYLRAVKLNDGMAAIGTGAKFALGAMAAGKSAAEAVEIASRFDPQTGGGMDVLPKPKSKQ